MRLIGRLIREHKGFFVASAILSVLSVLVTLYWNNALADVINAIEKMFSNNEKGINTYITNLTVNMIFIVLINTAFEYAANYFATYTCEIFAHEMRMGYVRFYLKTDVRKLEGFNVGEEQSAMQNEMLEISSYLKDNLFSLIKQFIAFILTAFYLLYQNHSLALVTILPVLPLIFYCSVSSRIIKKYTEKCLESKQKINGLIGVVLELFPVIKIYDGYRLINKSVDESLDGWKAHNVKMERISARLMTLSGVLSFVPLLILMCVGGYMVVEGKISLGVFYIFINLSGNVSGFLQNMPGIYAGFRRFRASADRIGEKMVLEEGK